MKDVAYSEHAERLAACLGALIESTTAHLDQTGHNPVVPTQLDLDLLSAEDALAAFDEARGEDT